MDYLRFTRNEQFLSNKGLCIQSISVTGYGIIVYSS